MFQEFLLFSVGEAMPWFANALQERGEEEGIESSSVCKLTCYTPQSDVTVVYRVWKVEPNCTKVAYIQLYNLMYHTGLNNTMALI